MRTDRTWRDVRRELRAEQPERRHVSRGTILGRWHEIKVALWVEQHGEGRCVPESAEHREADVVVRGSARR